MKEQFTPGPWKADTVPNSQGVIIGHFMDIYDSKIKNLGKKGNRIARLFGKSKIRIRANAKLVAAAPETYRLLKDLIEEMDGEGGIKQNSEHIINARYLLEEIVK